MPWLSKYRYESLLRAADRRIRDMGQDNNTFKLNLTGHLLLRVVPQQLSPMELIQNPFEYIHVQEVDAKMLIFVVHRGQGIIFEDNHAMFPSDEIVAKLRILLA